MGCLVRICIGNCEEVEYFSVFRQVKNTTEIFPTGNSTVTRFSILTFTINIFPPLHHSYSQSIYQPFRRCKGLHKGKYYHFKSDFAWRYGSNKSTKTVNGTIIEVILDSTNGREKC